MSWANEEFETINLGDKRLDCRTVLLAEQLAENPTSSIPGACKDWKETLGAYRLIANDKVNCQSVFTPHLESTVKRMAAQPVVLCVQDTTELNFNGQLIQDLGPLQYECQRGLFVHPTYAITPGREPLGVIDTWQWAREFRDENGERDSEVVESQRWIEGYERAAETAASLPDTRCVYLADREADIVALMSRAAELEHPADWLIRSKHNRVLPDGAKLWPTVRQEEALGELQFELGARRGVKARSVRQSLHVKTLQIPNGKDKGTLTITCLVASEVGTPNGKKAVEWRLVTNRPVSTLAESAELIDWYRTRWEIEMFFDILKNACKVEKLQLSTMDRLQTAIALFMVVAWRIN